MGSAYTSNRGLFSDHYLATRLPELPEWDGDYGPLLTRLSALLRDNAEALRTLSEAQTEQTFIRPVLDALGWEYETQITFRALDRDHRPDYALFLREEDRRKARRSVSSRRQPCGRPYLDKVMALAEAKYWERPLEERRADDARERRLDRGRSPHFQIIDYLRDSRVHWGLLTNGALWRLYLNGAETSEILYYEADLAGILRSGDADEFRRFCLFFRKDAFAAEDQGRCFLDRMRQESEKYAAQVEDSLKQRVFDAVVPAIAEGFLRHLREHKGVRVGTDDREALDGVYGGTLLLLYRLFFLLYAEARDLIAVGDGAGYHGRSLSHLKEEIYRAMRDGVALGTTSTDWWDDLRNLFRVINRGDPGLNVPRYNGGLFAPNGLGDPDIRPAAEFLEENAIADTQLASALMLLTRHTDREDDYSRPDSIDFRDLGVRHLGSVYEGLLEFKLNVADTYMVKASEKGRQVWKRANDPAKADKKPGDLYLTNDKRERKATGSYYTPDYIVRYIIENTIGPQVDRIERQYELAREIRTERGQRRPWDQLVDEVLQGKPAEDANGGRKLWDGLRSDEERRRFLLNKMEGVRPAHRYDPPTRVLELTVLDPALGSGHFLVGALDYMTTSLAAMLNKYPKSPVFERIREDRRKIVESLARQGIQADEEKLTDENLLRRMVMKRCLYGVDLNPLAVELSKLSLWLHAFTAGAPLSFLDHHVKCGNSLIGSKLEDLRHEAGKAGGLLRLPLGPLERAVQHMLTVAELSDASFEDVERSREEYWKADERVEGYRAMLDSLTAVHFGVPTASQVIEFGHDIDLERYRESLPSMDTEWREILEKARRIARDRRFFHWEVEFPEVFFERRGRGVDEKPDAGFDAVVGNPPWLGIRTGQIPQDIVAYLRAKSLASGQFDLAAVFLDSACNATKPSGAAGMVVPKRLATNETYAPLRDKLSMDRSLTSAVDLGVAFEGVNNDAAILISCGQSAVNTCTIGERIGKEVLTLRTMDREALTGMPYRIFPLNSLGALASLVASLAGDSIPFGRAADIERGAECGMNNEAITRKRTGKSLPVLDHLDVAPYAIQHSGWYVDRDRIDASVLKDTAIYTTIPKLLVRFLAAEFIAAIDDRGYASTNLLYHIQCRIDLRFLLTVLRSRLINAWYSTAFQNEEVKFPHVQKSHLNEIPVRRIFFVTPQKARRAKRNELVAAYETQQPSFGQILNHIQALLSRNGARGSVAFDESISMGEALQKAYIKKVPDYLDQDAPSGYDADGKPLEHSDVVHDFLAYLAKRMMEMHKQKAGLWDSIRTAFLNKGVDPDDLSSLAITKSIRDQVAKVRETTHPTTEQRRIRTYAEQTERAFGRTLAELHEGAEHNFTFESLPRLGFERFKWLAALRGADPALLDGVQAAIKHDLERLRDVLQRIGSDEWYPQRDRQTGEYDVENIRSTDWLIDQVVYRLYGLIDEEVRVVEGFSG